MQCNDVEQRLSVLAATVDALRLQMHSRESVNIDGSIPAPIPQSLDVQVAEIQRAWSIQRQAARTDWRIDRAIASQPEWNGLKGEQRWRLQQIVREYVRQIQHLVVGPDACGVPPAPGTADFDEWIERYRALRVRAQSDLSEFPLEPWSSEFILDSVVTPPDCRGYDVVER